MNFNLKIKNLISNHFLLLVFFIIFIVGTLTSEYFFTLINLQNMVRNMAVPGLLALGVSFVYSYSKKMLGKEFNFELFKFPSHLAEALNKEFPTVLCFSNYSWNFELANKFASVVK